MEIITIESEAYQRLVASIKRIEEHVLSTLAESSIPDEEIWVGSKEACKMLGIGDRALQNYRSKGIIDYRHCGKFCRYRQSDVKSLIAQGYGNRH